MTDKEKIRAEIERQIDEVVNPDSKILRVLIDIRNFIDSLPEETDNEETSRPKESDDLEEAAEAYVYEQPPVENWSIDGFLGICVECKQAFIAGAEWQKRKMMEGVESGEVSAVYKFDNMVTINVVHGRLNTPLFLRLSKYKGLKEGDKVKLIIVKANEQE